MVYKFLILKNFSHRNTGVTRLQSQEKVMGQSREIKQKWKGPRKVDVCLSIIFSYYDQSLTLLIKCPYSEFFWSVFSHIRTGHAPYSVWMRENTDQKNSEYGHFLRSAVSGKKNVELLKCWIVSLYYLSNCLR